MFRICNSIFGALAALCLLIANAAAAIYRLDASNNYQPRIFATITLNNRENPGASLGNMAFDGAHQQIFVSDLESGMIHRVRAGDGAISGIMTTARRAVRNSSTSSASSR